MKTLKKQFLFGPAICLLLMACGGNEKADFNDLAWTEGGGDDYMAANADIGQLEENVESTASFDEGLTDQTTIERKLIKTADLSFETDTLGKRKVLIDAAVKKFKGYVEQEEQYTSYDRENVTVTVRVPAEHFDSFIELATAGVGAFDNKSVSADDVTEEYVDVESRIQTKRELKERFVQLLDAAQTISEIVEIEREINALQTEIESYQARLKYLSGSVTYATVVLHYYELVDVPTHFDNKFERAFSNGWQGLIWFFVGVVSIWPFILIAMAIGFYIRYRLKRKKQIRNTK